MLEARRECSPKDFDQSSQHFPEISAALSALDTAVNESLPRWPAKRRRQGKGAGKGSYSQSRKASALKRLRNQVAWLRRTRAEAFDTIRELKGAKRGKYNIMSPAFNAKVALSSLVTSPRGFAQTWSDLIGVKDAGCSRTTISRIRDAFIGVVVPMVHGEVEAAIKRQVSTNASPAASGAGRPHVFSVALLHIQDEASLRLRSKTAADSAASAPVRSRGSKVQQNALWLHVGAPHMWPLLAELHPLHDKTARTIATSLASALQSAADIVREGCKDVPDGAGLDVWLIHVLVGDGIASNEKAARILRALKEEDVRTTKLTLP